MSCKNKKNKDKCKDKTETLLVKTVKKEATKSAFDQDNVKKDM